MPVNSLNHAKLTKVKASLDVNPVVNPDTPLVVYTHGWPAHRHFAADQLINLASHGYIVVAINHTGLSLFTEFPDGRRVDNIPGVQLDGKTSDLMFGMAEDIDSVVRYLKSDEVKENNLTIEADATGRHDNSDYVHKGIARRGFQRRFLLADTIEVEGAELTDGVLHIKLKENIPEEQRPKLITIN